jgi:Flp pilus assembly protein TadG
MRLRSKVRVRRGAALVELSFVLMVFLTLVLGMLDLGIGVFEYNIVSQVARAGARKAIIHGSMAPAAMGTWGPTTYGPVAATDTNPIAQAIAASLPGLDPSKVTIEVEWLDSNNQPEKRVRVTVTYPFQPMMTFIFGSPTLTLSAVSEMPIAH